MTANQLDKSNLLNRKKKKKRHEQAIQNKIGLEGPLNILKNSPPHHKSSKYKLKS